MMDTGSLPDYENRSDEQLMRLALDAGSLTTEAKSALLSVLKERGLDTPEQLQAFVEEDKHYQHLEDIDLGDLTLVVPLGVGRRAYGRANVDTLGTREEYDTTVFGVVFYFPLIPLSTYRFSCEQGSKRFVVRLKKPPSHFSLVEGDCSGCRGVRTPLSGDPLELTGRRDETYSEVCFVLGVHRSRCGTDK